MASTTLKSLSLALTSFPVLPLALAVTGELAATRNQADVLAAEFLPTCPVPTAGGGSGGKCPPSGPVPSTALSLLDAAGLLEAG